MNSPDCFTAAEIARGHNCSKQNVFKQLKGVSPDGSKVVSGNIAKAWSIESLPTGIIRSLAKTADTKRFRSIAALLQQPFARFEAKVALAEIAPASLDHARRLQQALELPLARRNDKNISATDFAQLGVGEYQRVFGYRISAKHWRAILDRTIQRDNGLEEWTRLELFLDENPARISSALPISAAREHKFDVLEDGLTSLAGITRLTADKRAFLWTKVCDELDLQTKAGANLKKTKRGILTVLQKSALLGCELEALRKTLSRKWETYVVGGGKLLIDRRALRYSTAEAPISEEDRRKLIARTLECGGRLAQAFRELHQSGELSPETTGRFIENPTNKSYVPHSVRKAVSPEAKRLMSLHHGPREHELKGAFHTRDYSKMFAGDSYQADDVTFPIVWWQHDSSNRWGYRIMRGQLLLMVDERSLLALGFALHSENNYNARIIRALITRVHDGFGLPRRRFAFEMGVWKNARILTGGRKFSDELEIEHTEMGLREFGIKFCHAKLPRGKVIERILGLIQNKMERFPGYVGRCEISDRFERVQKQISEARAGNTPPSEHFFSKEQWESELSKLFDDYNAERQQGRQLNGLSPIEAWNLNQSPEGQVQLGERARYLLAHHKIKLRVQRNGVTLRPSLGGHTYCGEATGRLRKEIVWAWVNPEEPDYIAITSLDGKRGPFVVPRLDPVPAIDATREQLARSAAQIDAHNDQSKTSYRLISPHFVAHNFRKAFVDAQTIAAGEQLRTGAAQLKTEKSTARSGQQKIRNLSRELNLDLPPGSDPQRIGAITEAAQMIRQSRQKRERQLQEQK